MSFPVIDLFAGPGGLAEGFSSLVNDKNERVFNIRLSIEKDSHAHQTLTLRSFVRQFPYKSLPSEYYEFLQGTITIQELYNLYPEQYKEATKEAWCAVLGETSENEIDQRISESLANERNWLLIGGPPCQAYSLVGRSRVGGIHQDDHRVHLYKEYLRIIARHQPAVFVMENVKGLLSAELNGEKIFKKIILDLRDPSSVFPQFESSKYKIFSLVKTNVQSDSDYLIKSELYGIPQKRHRVILLGIREDIDCKPGTLNQSGKTSLKSVIDSLPKIRSKVFRDFSHSETITTGSQVKKKRVYLNLVDSYDTWSERVRKYAADLLHTFEQTGCKLNFSPEYPFTAGREYFETNQSIREDHPMYNWYVDKKLEAALHHESRGHLAPDLKRYLFASLYTKYFHRFPKMSDYRKFGEDLLPDHENAESGKFNDRFRVQLPDEPATTVTSHISKDGHYFIHYDPSQCRSFTVREAARVQTFPDNYFFCGSRTQQFHQVGNAVPPYLAYQIAEIVEGILVPEKMRLQQELLLFENA